MGLFSGPYASMDWNGDGTIDHWDAGIETGVIMSISEERDREDRIRKMARAITRDGTSKQIGNAEFEELCWQEGLRMSDFDQSDIDEIQRRLNRW